MGLFFLKKGGGGEGRVVVLSMSIICVSLEEPSLIAADI